MTSEGRFENLEEVNDWSDAINKNIINIYKRLDAMKNIPVCRCQRQTPKTIELEIEWPEANIGGLHFSHQWAKGVFDLKEGGWYHSRDILFLSARNAGEGSGCRDTLSEYLRQSCVRLSFCQALKAAGVTAGEDANVEISLPKKTEGVKKYNGIDYWCWLFASYYDEYFSASDDVRHFENALGGCAPVFRVTEAGE